MNLFYAALVGEIEKLGGEVWHHADGLYIHVALDHVKETHAIVDKYFDELSNDYPSVVVEVLVLKWTKKS